MSDLSEFLVAKAKAAYGRSNFEQSKAISLNCIRIMQQLHHNQHHSHGEHLCSRLTACFLLALKSWATLANDTKLEQCVANLEAKLFPPTSTQCSQPVIDSPCLFPDFSLPASNPSQFNGTLESFYALVTKLDKRVEKVPCVKDDFLLLRLCELCLDTELYDYALNFSLQLNWVKTRCTDSRDDGDTVVNLVCSAAEASTLSYVQQHPSIESENAVPKGLTSQVWQRIVQHYSGNGYTRWNGVHHVEPDISTRVNHDVVTDPPREEYRQAVLSLSNHDRPLQHMVTDDLLLSGVDSDEPPINSCPRVSDFHTSSSRTLHNDLSSTEQQVSAHSRLSYASGYLNNVYDDRCTSQSMNSERTSLFHVDCFWNASAYSDSNAEENNKSDGVGDDILIVELNDDDIKQKSQIDQLSTNVLPTLETMNTSSCDNVQLNLSMVGDEAKRIPNQAAEFDATFVADKEHDDTGTKRRKSILRISEKVSPCSDSPQVERGGPKRVRFSLDPTHPSPAIEDAYGGRSNRRRLLDFAHRRQQVELATAATTTTWDTESNLYATFISPMFSVPRYILHCYMAVVRAAGHLGTAIINCPRLQISTPLTTWGLLLFLFCSCGFLLFFCYG